MYSDYKDVDAKIAHILYDAVGDVIFLIYPHSTRPSVIMYINDIVAKHPELYELLKVNVLMSYIYATFMESKWATKWELPRLKAHYKDVALQCLAAFEKALEVIDSVETKHRKEIESLDDFSKYKLIFVNAYIKSQAITLRRVLEYIGKKYGEKIEWISKDIFDELIYDSEAWLLLHREELGKMVIIGEIIHNFSKEYKCSE